MKQRLHSILKGVYLFIAAATMPLALWGILTQQPESNRLFAFFLLIYTYIYSIIWVVVFMAAGIKAFPKTLSGAVQTILGQALNFVIMFIFYGATRAFFGFTQGAVHYFVASTVVLACYALHITWRGIQAKKPRSGILAMGVFSVITVPYAVIFNIPLLKTVVTGTATPHDIFLWISTIALTLNGMRRSEEEYTKDLDDARTESAQVRVSKNRWKNFYLILMFASCFASILVIALT